jgi:hypothetical protein
MKDVAGEQSHACATTTVERFVCGECDHWYRKNSWKRGCAFKELLFGHCCGHCRDGCARAINGGYAKSVSDRADALCHRSRLVKATVATFPRQTSFLDVCPSRQ